MSKTINNREIAGDWAKFTIEKWKTAIKGKGIGVTQSLINSFNQELQMAGDDVKVVVIRFNFYGRFRDMGVGKGLKAYERGSNKKNLIAAKRYGANVSYVGRQPKKWYNKIKTAETYRLGELLATAEGKQLIQNIESDFSKTLTLKL